LSDVTSYFSAALTSAAAASSGVAYCCGATDTATDPFDASELFASPHPRMPSIVAAPRQPAMRSVAALIVVALLLRLVRRR
jgi:hypothetical protein